MIDPLTLLSHLLVRVRHILNVQVSSINSKKGKDMGKMISEGNCLIWKLLCIIFYIIKLIFIGFSFFNLFPFSSFKY